MPSAKRSAVRIERRTPRGGGGDPREGARTRILNAAYELFSRRGINAVGIDQIIAEAPVAKATLYHHFASKEDLVCAFLELRERRWTIEWLQTEIERRAQSGRSRALVAFDLLDEWFHRPDFEGCSFINTLLEVSDNDHPIHKAAVRHLGVIQRMLEGYADEAGVANAREVSWQLQVLMMGAIVSAGRGDEKAARHARALAQLML
jgi:AcrR family transcriptional regulator